MPTPSPTHRRTHRIAAAAVTLAVSALAIAPASPVDAAAIYYNGAGNAPRISVIGDSTIAALRWTGTFEPLQRFNYVYDAESCRRTIDQSCGGREGYAPDNVIGAMQRLEGDLGEVLALMVGYDDPGYSFAEAVDAVMAEAADQGIPHVMWLTLRTADVTYVGPDYSSNTYTFRDNNRILLQKAQQYGGRLQIADWATYSAERSDWVTSDGIHLTLDGAWAAADFIADQAAEILAGDNVTPQPGEVPILPWVSLRYGDRGASVLNLQEALIERGHPVFGGADGVFGAVTQNSVEQFQSANGLPVTGVVDTATATLLGLNNAGGVAAQAAWPELRYSMGGTAVAEAQQTLIDAGVRVRGGVTGEFDIYTLYAVQTFQRMNNLPASGIIDAVTARALGLFTGQWIELRSGMVGGPVTELQEALDSRGIHLANGLSGSFDIGTYYAVKTFQRYQGLTVSGVVDAATARALELISAPLPQGVWSNLSRGSSGDRVARAQRALMNAGIFVRGGASGQFDVWTHYAVQTFQRYTDGLEVTGVLDVATARKLGLFDLDDPVVTWVNLRLGSSGETVGRLERALINGGIRVRNGVDNVLGLWDWYAVQTYQRHNGLPVTGVVDLRMAGQLGMFGGAAANPTVLVSAAAPETTTSTTSTTTSSTTTSSTTTTTEPRTTTTSPTRSSSRATEEPASRRPGAATTTTSAAPSADRTATPHVAAAIEEPIESTGPIDTTEEPIATIIGGVVWLDANGDGVKDPHADGGIEDAEVILRDTDTAELARTRTEWDGSYEFAGLDAGDYLVELVLPADTEPTPALRGNDRRADSDLTTPFDSNYDGANEAYRTNPVASTDEFATNLDLGLVTVEAPVDTVPETTEEAVETAPATTEPPAETSEPAVETSEPVPSTEPPSAGGVPPTSTGEPAEPTTATTLTTAATTPSSTTATTSNTASPTTPASTTTPPATIVGGPAPSSTPG